MNSRLRPLAALAMVAVIGAGCSNAPDGGGPSANTGASAGGTSGNTGTTGRAQAVQFSECLRSNGVRDFPDPDAKGEYAYGVSVSPAVWQRAVAACKSLEPPGAFSSERDPQQQSAALQFAQCMRTNGVKDFPDPIDGEPLVDTYRIPSSNRSGGMAILDAAMQKCRVALDRAAAGR